METPNNTAFYTHNHQPPSSAVGFNLNIHNLHHHQEQDQEPQQLAKQNMFEKPLTPSDVGKLNRLVIPKQYAEKYFPMGHGGDLQKGLVLSFEDESGKLWRFRYSYWNSSQSYVLTKGWSRYVKEKQLDAGDVVLFQRDVLDCERMFIGWRCRFADVPGQDRMVAATVAQPVYDGGAQDSKWSTEVLCDAPSSYPWHHLPLALPLHAVDIYENADTYQRGEVATRRLRLFGVNLEYQDTSEPSDPYGSSHGGQSDPQYNFSSNNLHHNMMRYHQHEG